MARFVVVCPAEDKRAVELKSWADKLVPAILEKHPPPIVPVLGKMFARSKVERALALHPDCVLYFGHAKASALTRNLDALVDASNIHLASLSIFVTVACRSGKLLGPLAVRQGVTAYLGFDNDFLWETGDPDHLFEPAATVGIRRLIGGGTVDEAAASMRQGFQDAVDFYDAGPGRGQPNCTFARVCAFWDQQKLVVLGRGSATV